MSENLTPAQQAAISAVKYPTREEVLGTITAEEMQERIDKLSEYYTVEEVASLHTQLPLSYAAIQAFGTLAESLGLPVQLESYRMVIKRDKDRSELADIVAGNLTYEIHAQRVEEAKRNAAE